MRYYAILSDIHGNLPALEAVMAYLQQQQIDRTLILGDIVGYGAHPFECVQAVRMMKGISVIQGNHDRVASGEHDPYLRNVAREVLRWTRRQLSDEQIGFLADLPAAGIADSLFFTAHGSLYHPDEYIINSQIARRNLNLLRERFATVKVAFFGHTHVPVLISDEGIKQGFKSGESIELETKKAYLINPGAVGQPRDGNPQVSFAILDVYQWSVSFIRLDYDIERAQGAILEAGLPPAVADRLGYGL